MSSFTCEEKTVLRVIYVKLVCHFFLSISIWLLTRRPNAFFCSHFVAVFLVPFFLFGSVNVQLTHCIYFWYIIFVITCYCNGNECIVLSRARPIRKFLADIDVFKI